MKIQQELCDWLASLPNFYLVPLFALNDDDTVKVAERMSKQHGLQRLICRHPKMEEAIINIVRDGVKREDWRGLIYIMGKGRGFDEFQFLYVGKAEARGVRNALSANVKGVDRGGNKGKFVRWGDNLAYHIGDLSQAIFCNKPHAKSSDKYISWAQRLFKEARCLTAKNPLVDMTLHLNDPVSIYVAPWYADSTNLSGLPSTLAVVECDLIALGAQCFGEVILNSKGV